MSSNAPDLRIDWATHEAAVFACVRWHYSKSIPVGPMVRIGAWEAGKFIGVVLFSHGANNRLLAPYGLTMTEGCELTRVALSQHVTPVSRVVRIAVAFLRRNSPGLRLIVSFADPASGHHGGIYQALGWIYTGTSAPSYEFRSQGMRLQKRAYTGGNFGAPKMALPRGTEKLRTVGKHRYLMPLDAEMRDDVAPLAKPYPKREHACDIAH